MKIVNSCTFIVRIAALAFGCFFLRIDHVVGQSEGSLSSPANLPGVAPNEFIPNQLSQLQVSLPTTYPAFADSVVVQPKVEFGVVEMVNPIDPSWLKSHRPSAELSGQEQFSIAEEVLPYPVTPQTDGRSFSRPSVVTEAASPFFESLVDTAPVAPARRRMRASGLGLGHERLAFSLFDIDPAQPFNNFRIRTILASRMHLPDRAEYFWAKTGSPKGPPLGESVANYQEARLRMELGSQKFSTAFVIPFRAIDPQLNENHAGMGDLQLIAKTVLLDGKQWMLTQYFGTHFATGKSKAGLGTGHVSLEPGLLFRNELRTNTWMHGELKYWIPLGADPNHAGQVLKFALGLNRVWFESDYDALIPSLEWSAFSVLDGMATDSLGGLRKIDGDSIFYVTPGLRYALDKKGDFGLFEVGSAVSLAISKERFADAIWNIEMRWSW